jgi:fermentation-respiration switch protein FrsA (DUF1100 family)
VWVVLGHMRPADMTSWFDFAAVAADQDLTALTYNNRGYGASGGVREEYDVGTDALAAIHFARRSGAEAIFYVGASMNGTAALHVGAREDLAGVASLSGVPSFAGADGMGSVGAVAAPKLFVAARDDGDKWEFAEAFYRASAEPRTLLLFDEGGHGTAMFDANEAELTRALLEFLVA